MRLPRLVVAMLVVLVLACTVPMAQSLFELPGAGDCVTIILRGQVFRSIGRRGWKSHHHGRRGGCVANSTQLQIAATRSLLEHVILPLEGTGARVSVVAVHCGSCSLLKYLRPIIGNHRLRAWRTNCTSRSQADGLRLALDANERVRRRLPSALPLEVADEMRRSGGSRYCYRDSTHYANIQRALPPRRRGRAMPPCPFSEAEEAATKNEPEKLAELWASLGVPPRSGDDACPRASPGAKDLTILARGDLVYKKSIRTWYQQTDHREATSGGGAPAYFPDGVLFLNPTNTLSTSWRGTAVNDLLVAAPSALFQRAAAVFGSTPGCFLDWRGAKHEDLSGYANQIYDADTVPAQWDKSRIDSGHGCRMALQDRKIPTGVFVEGSILPTDQSHPIATISTAGAAASARAAAKAAAVS